MKTNLERGISHNTHPGEILFEDIILTNKITLDKTAKLLGISRSTLSNIVNCKSAIKPLMAIRIEKVFGGNAKLWIDLQSQYDLRKVQEEFKNKKRFHKTCCAFRN